MSLDDIQEDVDKWAKQFDPPYFPPLEQLGCLAEEVGEVARELNHLYGTKKKRPDESEGNLDRELAEVMFTVCCIANREGINLQQAWNQMMQDRQYGRDQYRYKKRG